jgi:hypothetical protein
MVSEAQAPPGFDKEMFHNLANQRNAAFKEGVSSSRNWMPPPSPDGNDYTCELMNVNLGISKDRQTQQEIPYFRLTFRIADEDHTDGENNLVNRRFGQAFFAREKGIGILSRVVAALYGSEPCPEELGPALMGLPDFRGVFYTVAVREARDPQYGHNLYVNRCLGRGEAETCL